jgi:hypothetical protein
VAILSKLLSVKALLVACVVGAYPALAQQPLYIGDFDGPLDRNECRPIGPNRVDCFEGDPFKSKELVPAGRPSKIIPAREKGFVDFLKVEKNSNGQLFIRSADKKIFLLKLSEAQVRFFFGTPNTVKKYDKQVRTAKLDQVFEYVCYNDDVLSKLFIGFEKKVVCRAVVKHWDTTMGTPGLGNGHTQKDLCP